MMSRYDENDEQRMREELAREQYDAWADGGPDATVDEWMAERLYEYAQSLLRGGDWQTAALRSIERDCIGWLVNNMDDDKVAAALDGERITAQEAA
jgi:hypothetical protein